MTPHPFNRRTRDEPNGQVAFWCADCEYHRDHEIHAVEASRLASPPATTEPNVNDHAKDIRAIVSSYGYLLMRLAVAADAQDTFDVCKKEFTEHETALKRLRDAFIHNRAITASPPETAPALDLDKLALHPYRISRGNWTRCPVTDESEFEPCDDADVVTVREALLVCRQLATEIERLRAAAVASPPETAPI